MLLDSDCYREVERRMFKREDVWSVFQTINGHVPLFFGLMKPCSRIFESLAI